MTRDYIPVCIGNVTNYAVLEEYAVKRAKFNIFMIVLYCILFCIIAYHWLHLMLSPALRQYTDKYTWILLALF